ncbi:hypothetical protein SERLA73DRAFT_26290, partial [Serpula lacrymans var. lacrymans S7.3]
GIQSVAVNGDTYNQDLHKELEDLKYQILLASPELTIENPQFNALLCSPAFQKCVLGYIVDEAHCISQWGGDFRPVYVKFNRLRSFVPLGTPIYAMSATMSPAVLAKVRKTLHISASKSFHLNLGNDRPNVTQELRIIAGSTDYSALDFIV